MFSLLDDHSLSMNRKWRLSQSCKLPGCMYAVHFTVCMQSTSQLTGRLTGSAHLRKSLSNHELTAKLTIRIQWHSGQKVETSEIEFRKVTRQLLQQIAAKQTPGRRIWFPPYSWCISHFICCCICIVSFLLKMFASIFIRDIGL